MKNIIGLTGPTGSGKSSFAVLAQQNGIDVIDCDKLSRLVTQNGSECLSRLSDAFGKDIIKDGSLDRKLLAQRAFKDDESKALLEEIIFPFILMEVFSRIENSDKDYILLDAPTLFESGIDKICDKTVAVLADKEVRLERIVKRDNISKEDALLRISAGKSDEFYIQNADAIMYNNTEINEFLNEFNAFLDDTVKGE